MKLDINLETVVSRIAATALAVVLVAPSLKIRFALTDFAVYLLPFGLFVVLVLFANSMHFQTIVMRIRAAFIFLCAFAGPFMAYYLGGATEFALLSGVGLNMGIGVLVIMYPWTLNSMHAFIQTLAAFGVLIAANTLLFYGSDEELQYLTDVNGDSYLNVSYLQTSFVMGLGVICATYLIVKQLNPFTIIIFLTGWLGLAVGRGRGALIFCIAICVLYLLLVLGSRVSSFGRGKKFFLVILIASFVPAVVAQTLKVGRNSQGLQQIFANTDVELVEGGRGALWRIAYDRWMESPLIGNGLGAHIDNDYSFPHNLFLQWGVDSGLVGLVLLVLFWLFVARATVRSLTLSNAASINLVYVCAAVSLYVLMNYMKSGDAYIGRDIHILSVLPVACFLAIQNSNFAKSRRRRRRRRPRQTG